MHASLPALAAARAAHIAAACLHTPCIAERRLPLGPARKPEATRVRADQDHLFRGGPWHALSSLARAHARVPAHLSTRPVTAQPSCVPERLRTCQHAPQTAFFPAACVPLPARRVPTSRTPRALHAPRACVLVAWAALHRLTPRPAHAAHRFLRDRRVPSTPHAQSLPRLGARVRSGLRKRGETSRLFSG